MSVLIKGMEMPETCSDCEWSYYVGNGRAMCRRVSKTDKTDIMTKRRADFCPLTEINTPHGRLIDIKSVEEGKFVEISNGFQRWWNGALESVIDNAPTVIEAEE